MNAKDRLAAWAKPGGANTPTATGGSKKKKEQSTVAVQASAKGRLQAWAESPTPSARSAGKPAPASTPNVSKSNTSAGALPTALQSVSKQITDAAAKVKGQARQVLPKASQATRTGGTLPATRKSSGLTGAELSASIDMFKPSSALWRASAGVQPGSAADVQHRAVESALTRVNYQLEQAKAEDDKLGMSFASVDPRGNTGVRNAEAHSKAVSEKRKEIEDLSAQKAKLEFQKKYGFLQYNPDFEEKSRPDPSVIQARVKSIITGEEDPDTYENPVYAAINGEDAANRQIRKFQGYTYTDVPEDVAKVYNYLYHTQGAKAAQDYLDQAVAPEVTTHGAISRAAGKALGWQGITDLLTGGATAKHNEAVAGAAAGQHPVAYNVAAGVSGLGGMVIGGDILGGAAEALPMASKLSPTALTAAKTAATFGGSTAVQNVSPMLAGNITPGEYALSVAGSAAGGGLGSLAAKGMTSLGTKALFKTGLQHNVFANALNQGLGGATFAGVNAGTKAVIDPNYNPTGGELATDMAVSFAFQTITSAISLAATTKQAKAAMRQEAEALKRDFYNLSEAKKAGVITDADTLDLLRYRSATLRNKLNTTQYIGAGKEVSNALAFLDQLDDAVAAAEHGLHGTMLGSAAPAPGAGTGTPGVPILPTGGSPAPITPGPTSPAGLAPTGDATTAPGVGQISLPQGTGTSTLPTATQATTGEKTASTGEAGTLPDMDRTFESRKVPTFEELTAKADVPVVDIRQRPEGRIDKQRAAFRESVEALDIVGQPLRNDDTGAAVFVTSKTFSHMFSDLGLDQVGAAQKLREIIRTALLTDARPSRSAPRDNSTGVYTLFGAVRTEAGVQPVKLTIKEYRLAGQDIPKEIKSYFERSGRALATYAQNYDTKVLALEDMKKEGASSSALREGGNPPTHKYPSTPSSISVADLLELVKGDAEKYIPTPSSATTATKDAGMPLPTAQEQAATVSMNDDAMDAENWDSLMRTFEAPLEPLSDEWYESLLTTGETGYVPKETRSATDIAVDQGLEEYQEAPRAPRRPTAEEVEADKFNQAMATFGKKMLKDYDSKAEGVEAGLQNIFQQMGADGGLSREQLEASTQELARRILAQSSVPDETAYQDSKPVRALIRDKTIHVPPEVASNIPDFADFRKRYFGSMKLSSTQGREIDDLFRELGGMNAGYFNEAEYSNPADQLARIAEYLDEMKPTSSNPYEAVMDDASAYLGKEISDMLLQLDSRRRALRAAASVREAQAAFFASAGPDPRGPEKVAEVLTELPTAKAPTRERGKELRHSLYRALVDSGETVGRIGKAIGDDSLYSFYNFARASGSAGQNMLARGGYQADIWGKKVGPSLGDIFAPIREKGDDYYRDFQMYLLHMHNVDRMSRYNPAAIDIAQADFDQFRNAHPDYDKLSDAEVEAWAATGDIFAQEYMRLSRELTRVKNTLNKPVFGEDVDAAESRGAANQLLRSHPEFKDLAEGVYQYSRNLLQYRVDSGMMTPEDMDMIQATYPHYVPVFRITDSDAKIVKQSGIRISKGLGHATGGNADIVPLHVAMDRQAMNVVRNGSANRFASRLLSGYYANKDTVSSDIFKVQETVSLMHPDTFDMLDDPTLKDKNAFTVYKDGEALTVTASKGLLTAMGALTGKGADWMGLDIWRPIEAMNTMFKELVTGYNPMFTVRNAARDLQEAGLYSRDPVLWAKAYPRAVKEIATNGPLWQRYKSLGGIHASVYDYNKGYTEAGDGHSKLRKYTLDKVDILNEGVEQAPRLAEFIAQLEKNGDTPEGVMDAMYAAHNVTTNFGRSGEVTKFLNKTFVPFLNPGVQGLDKMGRAFFGKKSGKAWMKLIKRCAVLGFLPMLINEIINQGAPNWEDVRDSDKDTNWLIHIGDGKYLRIPKGRDISVVGMVGDRAVDAVRGQKVDVGGTLKTAADQIAPASPFSNNILAAFLDTDLFDPNSPGKTWYGGDIESQRLQGYEPGQRYDEKTDAISKAIGGAVNVSPKKINYLLDQYTGVAGDFVLPLLTPAGDKDPLSPFKKAFVLDAATSNSVSTDFYDTIDQITYDVNGGNAAKSLSAKFMSKQSSEVSDIYKQIRVVENSSMPNSEKVAKVRDLKIAAVGIQKNALEVLPTFEVAVEKHLTGTDDEALDAAYREANREVFGAEYALQMEGKATYEKAQKAHALGASYESYYEAYVKLKGKTTTWEKEQAFREMDIPEADRNAIFSATQGDTSYLKFKHAGLAQEDAQKAAWAVDTLLPSYGRSSVSDAQKWRAVLNCGIPQDKAVDALGAIMDDTQTRKLETAVDCGLSPTVYVTFRELMAKESGQKQADTERVLDTMVLDKKQKAVLWQMQNTSWPADSNPYSRVVGRQVKEIYAGKK